MALIFTVIGTVDKGWPSEGSFLVKKRQEKPTSGPNTQEILPAIMAWYFRSVYERWEGPGVLPFYCDPSRVGSFAVNPEELSANQEEALFKLLVATMMFQALRDVLIMRQQYTMKPAEVEALSSLTKLREELTSSKCPQLSSANTFEKCCSVSKRGDKVDCVELPGEACHVKEVRLFRRVDGMGGKLPTSAWLRLAKVGGLVGLFKTVCKQTFPMLLVYKKRSR